MWTSPTPRWLPSRRIVASFERGLDRFKDIRRVEPKG
jgi:hypothetical protein